MHTTYCGYVVINIFILLFENPNELAQYTLQTIECNEYQWNLQRKPCRL